MSQVVLVFGDDWQGLYVDGFLSVEGHAVATPDALPHLVGKTVDSYEEVEANQTWLERRSCLPLRLRDVKRK